ncbi:alpha/beta fold hydrolase [Methylobacterium oryzihabitans]|uniref:Alpha/beta hydrolase n=1 Tax=Methylobacterium oryzihabitans TaxID=2499852 RepID=A0A437PH14_9HYPH|nr:alpha/beta hydrolase [Methylobacterium oryzihabitans]RVU21561.1 alpha/beta hydrolase [Methylobacterium oryzihabitans]
MRIEVNGVRLYVDVEGAGLVPDGPRMRSTPTLIALHGGPGIDHTVFKPALSSLSDLAQIVYVDHRGNGRSDDGDPQHWTLAQWGDDVKALCDVLGIERPIVFGASFGGYVAQAYATRHPEHPGGLILASTLARFEIEPILAMFDHLGGPRARSVAESYWQNPTPERRGAYMETCLPLYSARGTGALSRCQIRHDVAMRFNGPRNEQGRMDYRADLARIRCPVLVMAGDRDPMTPPACSETLVGSLPHDLVRFERFEGCGHSLLGDDTDRAIEVIRDFIQADSMQWPAVRSDCA